MPPHAHLDGPALRALVSGGHPAFVPPPCADAADKPRDRIWELAESLHCSIVGTCLTNAEARAILAKLGRPDARTITEHRLHGEIVQIAGRKDGGGRLLQKALDRRHEREIERFAEAHTAEAVRALWRASVERGEIPGAYWAAITHPATDWTLVQDVFGEVHMLSHLVGQSNRADIRRLRQLEADLAERDERIAALEGRVVDLMEQRDGLSVRNRAIAAEQALSRIAVAEPADADRENVKNLTAHLERERAHAEALEEKVAVLMHAAGKLSADLEAEAARRQAVEAELAAVEALLAGANEPIDAHPLPCRADRNDALAERTLLYVGGRPRQVARLRRFVEARGGRLLSHDGGTEENMSLLPGLVSRSDLVLFPVECVSHEATGMVKRACEMSGKAFRPVRSASLASFVHAIAPAVTCAGAS
ncbi:hypothetical protein SAMN02799622_04221 [Methylobacterium sp. UNC378MF]|uniref:DUF2325 domain-containing protein n=1 Tax=Methylobacterium oryzae TaxID=334852 RepID=A0ABU7TL78_9HYPH|nr:DUF2325 domain-containing protein [Methylobacterium sp. UNC378MF]SDA28052.1 hypothetical protein SAMN02799622_04221 [Methylobacterium sp. UNC378MF]